MPVIEPLLHTLNAKPCKRPLVQFRVFSLEMLSQNHYALLLLFFETSGQEYRVQKTVPSDKMAIGGD
jgi:hypothetical protein